MHSEKLTEKNVNNRMLRKIGIFKLGTKNICVFWGVKCLINMYRSFGGTFCPHRQGR